MNQLTNQMATQVNQLTNQVAALQAENDALKAELGEVVHTVELQAQVKIYYMEDQMILSVS